MGKVMLVLRLLGIDEDDVEDVLELMEDVERVRLDQLHPFLEPGSAYVPTPAGGRLGIALDGEDAPAEITNAGAEPDG